MPDDFLESIVRSNIDGFLSDAQTDAGQGELTKHLRDIRQEQEVDHEWNSFVENLDLSAATGGRTGHSPRLRSERRDIDPDDIIWRPGMDPNLGLGEPFQKRTGSKRKKPARVIMNPNGSTTEYDENGAILRHYAKGVDPSVFDFDFDVK